MRRLNNLLKPLRLSVKKFSSNQSVEQAQNITRTMWDWGDKTYKCGSVNFHENGYAVDCNKGCNFCCFQNVRINIFEAIIIADWVQNNVTDIVKSKIHENAELIYNASVKDKNDSERWIRRQPCPCLDLGNKVCLIYEVRPLECRLAISHDAIGCQNKFNDKTSKSISILPPPGIEIGLPKGTKHANLIHSLADYITISLLECIHDYLMNLIYSKQEISGNFIYPKTAELLTSITDMELSRTMKFVLSGNTNQKIKSLVKFTPSGIAACSKTTDITQ